MQAADTGTWVKIVVIDDSPQCLLGVRGLSTDGELRRVCRSDRSGVDVAVENEDGFAGKGDQPLDVVLLVRFLKWGFEDDHIPRLGGFKQVQVLEDEYSVAISNRHVADGFDKSAVGTGPLFLVCPGGNM